MPSKPNKKRPAKVKKPPAAKPGKPVRLNLRQERFVDYYVATLDRVAAYKAAGYSANGHVAYSVATELLNRPHVAAAIVEAMESRKRRVEIDNDYVLRGLQKEAEYMGEGTSHAARITAYVKLGDHLRMFPNNLVVTGKGGGPIEHDHVHEHHAVTHKISADDMPLETCRKLLELREKGDTEGIKTILLQHVKESGNGEKEEGRG